ncbi:MAG: LamG-like jellyroll fold domain-containing protein [Myxococcota bacterium]
MRRTSLLATRAVSPLLPLLALGCGAPVGQPELGEDHDQGSAAAPTSEFGAPSASHGLLHVDVTSDRYNALGDGVHDDGPTIQRALDDVRLAGGGEVYLPAGTYKIDQTLRIGDHTTLRGEDRETATLVRTNTPTDIGPTFKWIDGRCVQETEAHLVTRSVIVNHNYNCGNEGIELRDFGADGSLVTGVPSVGIALSGTKLGVIDGLLLHDMAQDGIYLKNGGQETRVTNTLIDGFNMHWYNGGGINIEMHGDVRYPGGPLIEGNTIWARGPAFCTDDRQQPCDEDSDCTKGVCPATTQIVGITALTHAGAVTASPTIVDNHVAVYEGHLGIRCMTCEGSEISGNVIKAQLSTSARSGRMWGMLLGGNDLEVEENRIYGAGVPDDTRGVLVEGGQGLRFANNVITNKNISHGSAAVTIRDQVDYAIHGNEISGITGAPALELGPPGCTGSSLQGGSVEDNFIEASIVDAVDLRSQWYLRMVNNDVVGTTRAPCGAVHRWVYANELPGGPTDGSFYDFDNDDHHARTNVALVPATDPFTISAIVSPSVSGNDGPVLAQHYDFLGEGMFVSATVDTLGMWIGAEGVHASVALEPDQWYSIAVTRDAAGAVVVYLDGDIVASGVMPSPIDQRATTIARIDAPIQYEYAGGIDALWVLGGALTPAEIAALHSHAVEPGSFGLPLWEFEAFAAAP